MCFFARDYCAVVEPTQGEGHVSQSLFRSCYDCELDETRAQQDRFLDRHFDTMKIFGAALSLALCASSITAFHVQAPKAYSPAVLNSFAPGGYGSDTRTTAAPDIRPGVSTPEGSQLEPRPAGMRDGRRMFEVDEAEPVIVQGGSLRTWSFADSEIERVQVILRTEGRPLESDVELWQGPDNAPQRMRVYIEDGSMRQFNCLVETPRGSNAIAVRNTHSLEFPLEAIVGVDNGAPISPSLSDRRNALTIQGGAVHTYPFPPSVESVQILMRTDGRPLNARIELLQGPNNNKQVIDIYNEDGLERPFYAAY